MNRVVLAAAFALALGLLVGVRAQESEPHVKPAPWEYRVFSMQFSDYKDKDDWKDILARNAGNEPKADSEFKAYVLNSLGASEGWELVQVLNPKPELTIFYLKRPKVDAKK